MKSFSAIVVGLTAYVLLFLPSLCTAPLSSPAELSVPQGTDA